MSATPPAAWARRTGTVTVPVARFPGLSEAAYAVIVHGDGLAPQFRDGDVLIVDPRRALGDGDVAVLWPQDETKRAELRQLGAVHAVVGRLERPP